MKKLILIGLLLFTITLTACTVKEEYTVTFVQSVENSIQVKVQDGETVEEPTQPVLEGNTFLGWYSDSTLNVVYDFSSPVKGNLTLYSKFETNTYNVRFYSNETEYTDIDVPYGEDISVVMDIIDIIDGFTYYLDAEYTDEFDYETMPAEDISIYGKYDITALYPTIYFDSAGGSPVDEITQEGTTVLGNLPVPTKEGYTFRGWYDATGNGFLNAYMPTDDITLYAHWGLPVITFGFIGPLSNDYSMYGNATLNRAMLAVQEINAAGGLIGFDIEIIAKDSQGSPVEGVLGYNQLIDDNHIDALIGGVFSGVSLGIKDLVKQDGIPMITPTASHPDVTLDAPNIFRACYTDVYQGSVAATFAAVNLESINAAVFYNRDDAYSESLANAFMDEYDARSLDYEEFDFGYNDDDFTTQLTAIKNGSFDVVYLPSYVAEASQILTQADALALDVPFIGGDGWGGIEETYSDVVEGFFYITHYSMNDQSDHIQDFITNYEAEFGESPTVLSALGYDAVYAMFEAIAEVGTVNSSEVVDALSTIPFEGRVTGEFYFDSDGNPIKVVTVVQIVDGEQVVFDVVSIND